MGQEDWVAGEIAPWLESVAALQRWQRETGAPHPRAEAVGELRDLLQALAARKVAVPAEMPLARGGLEGLAQRPDAAALLQRWRARRAGLLRLGVWRVLHALHSRDDWAPQALASLQGAMAQADPSVPPGLAPTLGYAGSGKAREFFGSSLRQTLLQLGKRHPGHAALMQRLDAAGRDVASVAGAQAWSEAWSVAIAANYLDCLDKKSRGNILVAMTLVWGNDASRMHAADGLLLLPARERHLHIDLWTDLVQAQALEHRHERFAAAQPWHRVGLKMHDLGVREEGRNGGRARIDRGISVDLLHLPAFTNRAQLALRAPTRHAAAPAHPPGTLVLDLPQLAPGQEANFRLVLRLHGTPAAEQDDAPRRLGPIGAPVLDPVQQGIYAQWLEREEWGAARELPASEIGWRAPATEARALHAAAGVDLGSGALWRAAASSGQMPGWLDVALVMRRQGHWATRDLTLYANTLAGQLHCGLMLDPAAGPAHEAAALRRALGTPGRARWVACRAGLGAFVMASVDLDRELGHADAEHDR